MRKFCALFLVLIMSLSNMSCGDATDPISAKFPKNEGDFRGATWGMTKEQVRALEKAEFVEEGAADFGRDGLTFKSKLAGADVLIKYVFDSSGHDNLSFGGYDIQFSDSQRDSEFERFYSLLKSEYGEASSENYYREDYEIVTWIVNDLWIDLVKSGEKRLWIVYHENFAKVK